MDSEIFNAKVVNQSFDFLLKQPIVNQFTESNQLLNTEISFIHFCCCFSLFSLLYRFVCGPDFIHRVVGKPPLASLEGANLVFSKFFSHESKRMAHKDRKRLRSYLKNFQPLMPAKPAIRTEISMPRRCVTSILSHLNQLSSSSFLSPPQKKN